MSPLIIYGTMTCRIRSHMVISRLLSSGVPPKQNHRLVVPLRQPNCSQRQVEKSSNGFTCTETRGTPENCRSAPAAAPPDRCTGDLASRDAIAGQHERVGSAKAAPRRRLPAGVGPSFCASGVPPCLLERSALIASRPGRILRRRGPRRLASECDRPRKMPPAPAVTEAGASSRRRESQGSLYKLAVARSSNPRAT
jgi:hypothetical protein